MNRIFTIKHFNAGGMIIAPQKVNGRYVFNGNWEINVTRKISIELSDLGSKIPTAIGSYNSQTEIGIEPGVYQVQKTKDAIPHNMDTLMYNADTKQFVFQRYMTDTYQAYVEIMSVVSPEDKNAWNLLPNFLPGTVRCVTYRNGEMYSNQCTDTYLDVSKMFAPGELITQLTGCMYSNLPSMTQKATFYFPKGEYLLHGVHLLYNADITIEGDGPENSVIRFVSDQKKDTLGWVSYTTNRLAFKNITVRNMNLVSNYEQTDDRTVSFEMSNVHNEWTIDSPSGYMFNFAKRKTRLRISDSKFIAKKVYCGINIYTPDYVIENSYFYADDWGHPISVQESEGGAIRNCRIINGIVGVIHIAAKGMMINRAVVENCEFDGQTQESIAFDCIGNEVERNPVICQCAVSEATAGKVKSAQGMRLKIAAARGKTGSHQTGSEKFEKYDIWANKELIQNTYVVFNQNAGDGYVGTFAKIEKVEQDAIGTIYLTIGRRLKHPMKLAKPADIHPDPDNTSLANEANYTISISSGFFFCRVQNNVVRNNPLTAISLFCAFYGGLVTGNFVQNCGRSYLCGANVLNRGNINNGAYGNIIANNVFVGMSTEDGDEGVNNNDGFRNGGLLIYAGDSKNLYHNMVSNNILIDTNLRIEGANTTTVTDNNIQWGTMIEQ